MVGWHHRLNGHEQTLGGNEGQGSLACCRPWGRKESDRTEQLNNKIPSHTGTHIPFKCNYSFLLFIAILSLFTKPLSKHNPLFEALSCPSFSAAGGLLLNVSCYQFCLDQT